MTLIMKWPFNYLFIGSFVTKKYHTIFVVLMCIRNWEKCIKIRKKGDTKNLRKMLMKSMFTFSLSQLVLNVVLCMYKASFNTNIRGVHQPNEPDNPIQTASTKPEKSNPKLLDWVVGFVYVNLKLLGWVVDCESHNPTQLKK